MEVIEQTIIGKRGKAYCEDGLVVTDNFIAVIDGSTSKTEKRYSSSYSNGQLATRIISDTIKNAEAHLQMEPFCKEVTEKIACHYKPEDISHLLKHPEERLCASAVILSRERREIWMIGDCLCMIDGVLYENPKPYEQPLADKRAAIAHELLKDGRTIEQLRENDEARAAIIEELKYKMKGENIDYAVIDGFDIPLQKVKVISLNTQQHEVILASDGYPILSSTLEESEAQLDNIINNDPLCINLFHATKGLAIGANSFDDRTFIRVKL